MSHACHRFWKCYKTFTFCTFDKVHNPLRLPRESTSERPKVLRTPQFFAHLTSKCASRHNGINFFDIATSKIGPSMVCFVHVDFEMYFAATTAWTCSSLIWPAGSAPAALASLLFDPPEPQRCFVSFLPFRAPASSDSFSSLIFSLLLFSSLFFCSTSAFHLSILSEVWLLNFLRILVRVKIAYPKQITNAQSNCGFLIHLRNLCLCLSVSVSASVSVSVQPAIDLRRIGLVRENLDSRLKNPGFYCLTHRPTNWLGLQILSRHCRATIAEDQNCLPQADHECPVQLRVPDPST